MLVLVLLLRQSLVLLLWAPTPANRGPDWGVRRPGDGSSLRGWG